MWARPVLEVIEPRMKRPFARPGPQDAAQDQGELWSRSGHGWSAGGLALVLERGGSCTVRYLV